MSKERLVELIKSSSQYITEQDSLVERIADYILSDGWIRPPCKVGDIVYEVVAHFSYIIPCEVVGFHIGNFPTLNGHKRKPYLVCYDKTSRLLRHIPLDKLGKTAFFKIEEAEKKLEEMKGE